MSKLRKILLGLLSAAILTVIILTWGSVGSAVMAFCLILAGSALLYQRFLNNHDQDSWDME